MELRPGVVFLDLGTPKMDGFEAARQIRASRLSAQSRLIALTGWAQESDLKRSGEAAFDHHLLKPVDSNMLLAVLEKGSC